MVIETALPRAYPSNLLQSLRQAYEYLLSQVLSSPVECVPISRPGVLPVAGSSGRFPCRNYFPHLLLVTQPPPQYRVNPTSQPDTTSVQKKFPMNLPACRQAGLLPTPQIRREYCGRQILTLSAQVSIIPFRLTSTPMPPQRQP